MYLNGFKIPYELKKSDLIANLFFIQPENQLKIKQFHSQFWRNTFRFDNFNWDEKKTLSSKPAKSPTRVDFMKKKWINQYHFGHCIAVIINSMWWTFKVVICMISYCYNKSFRKDFKMRGLISYNLPNHFLLSFSWVASEILIVILAFIRLYILTQKNAIESKFYRWKCLSQTTTKEKNIIQTHKMNR